MPERSNGAVSKTVVLLPRDRGFESPSLRKAKTDPAVRRGCLFYRNTVESLLSKGIEGKINKNPKGLFWICWDPPTGIMIAANNPPLSAFARHSPTQGG